MVDNSTIELGIDKRTENYAVFESADGDTVVGMYVSEGAAEALGDFASLTVSEDAEVMATKDKDTQNYGVYSTEGGAVSGMYVSHDVLESEENEDGDRAGPESIGLTLSPSDEESFEAEQGVDEAEEEALVSGDTSDDDESEDEEEVEIADEEVGLVDAE